MRYVVTAPLTLPAGLVIGLDPAQAELRAQALEAMDKGQFRTLKPIDLKVGECVSAVALPKASWASLKEAPRPPRLERQQQ